MPSVPGSNAALAYPPPQVKKKNQKINPFLFLEVLDSLLQFSQDDINDSAHLVLKGLLLSYYYSFSSLDILYYFTQIHC